MCRLNKTEDLHHALADVAEGRVVFHSGLSGPMLGFYWAPLGPDGAEGTPNPAERAALDDLYHARLIEIAAPPARHWQGNNVLPTTEGTRRLHEWADENHLTTH